MRYLCMKPVIDTRESENVIKSRIGIERECRWIYPDTDLYEFAKEYFKAIGAVVEWFLVDEAQFLTAAQVDQLSRVVDDFGSKRDMLRSAHRFPDKIVRGLKAAV